MKTVSAFLSILALALLVLAGCVQSPVTPEPVACTADAKLCPDGSYVGREGPNCEFAACPGEQPNPGCTEEAKICPDGTTVVREGPNCAFAPCPTGPPVPADDSTIWFTIKPVQCQTNAWETWHERLGRVYIRAPTEQEILTEWLKEVHAIDALEFRAFEPAADDLTIVCRACGCSRGDTLAVRVNQTDRDAMRRAGFTSFNGCPKDLRVCPDGSSVPREEPFCEFRACAGSGAFEIEIERSGGFVPYEVAGSTTIVIKNKTVTLTHAFVKSGKQFTNSRALSNAEFQAWKDLVANSGMMDLEQDDLDCQGDRPCVADAPNHRIKITMDNKAVDLSTDQFQSHAGWNKALDEFQKLVDELDVATMDFAPKQCNTNPWQVSPSNACQGKDDGTTVFSGDTCNSCSCQGGTTVCTLAYCATDDEEKLVKAYLSQVYGIEVKSYAHIPMSEDRVVCAACSCPRGDTIRITIDGWQAGRLIEINWSLAP